MFTLGNVVAETTTSSFIIPFKNNKYAVTEYTSESVKIPGDG